MQIGVELGAQRAAQQAREQQAAERAQEFQQQMSAEQAAQQFKMQQAAKASQLQAQEQARADAEFQLRSSQAADKARAVMEYQQAIQGGMDPLQAVLKFGPAIGGQASPEAAALRQNMQKPKPTVQMPTLETYDAGGRPVYAVVDRMTGRPALVPNVKQVPEISASERAQTLKALSDERKDLIENQNADMIEKKAAKGMSLTEAEQAILGQLQDIDAQKADLLPRLKKGGTKTAPAKSKVQRAKEIAAEHPEWTKQQVIKAVNDEFK
jgi:hypothetical protein